MGVPIVRGRNFDDGDRRDGQRVMIVSARLAALAFPGQDPIGKRINCCEPGPQALKTIVGIAGDIRSRGPALPPGPEFYLPLAQVPDVAWSWFRTLYIVARTPGDPSALIKPLSAAVMQRRSRLAAVRRTDHGAAPRRIVSDRALQHGAAQPPRRRRIAPRRERDLRGHRLLRQPADTGDRRADGARSDARQRRPADPVAGHASRRGRRGRGHPGRNGGQPGIWRASSSR